MNNYQDYTPEQAKQKAYAQENRILGAAAVREPEIGRESNNLHQIIQKLLERIKTLEDKLQPVCNVKVGSSEGRKDAPETSLCSVANEFRRAGQAVYGGICTLENILSSLEL